MATVNGRGKPSPALSRVRVATTLLTFLVLLALPACEGPDEAAEPDANGSPDAAQEAVTEEAPVDGRARLAELGDFRTGGPPVFAHGPHGLVDCVGCHRDPPGHASHATVRCGACHEGAETDGRVLSSAECLACHHDPERGDPCTRCHEDPAGMASAVLTRTLHLADVQRERSLPFRHAVHGGEACRTCHGAGVVTVEAVDCLSCHQEHHRPTSDCAACHQAPREGAHDGAAHRGCDGTGCHDDPAILALPDSRAVCLSCHREQEDHEPGRDCAPCHQLPRDAEHDP